MPTSDGIVYEKDKHCIEILGMNCNVSFSPTFTDAGDGTVLTASNAKTSDISYFINLKEIKKDKKDDIKHADILESTDTLNLVKDQVANAVSSTNYGKYITTTEPVDTDKWLTIKIYSPVDIDVYDKDGNHTGLIENPIAGKNLEKFENNIPLSLYGDYGRIKLVRLLYGEDYQIVLKGNDAGVFSADAKVEQFDKVIASTTFSDMPVTPLMNVDLIISMTTSSFATSSLMNMDVDGDGNTDFINHSDEFLNSTSTATTTLISDISTYIESMKKIIVALKLPVREEEKWLKRIDIIAKAIEKKNPHIKRAEKIIKKLSNKRFKNRALTNVQRNAILSVFENLLNRIEIDYKINL
jgi:hypothetical protein